MADGDYYADYDDIQDILQNADLGTDGNTLLDDEAIEKILKISQAKIHLRLGLSTLTSQTDVIVDEILREIQVAYVMQWVLAARHFNENNLSDIGVVQTFWTIAPTFTYAQEQELRWIKRKISTTKGMYNHNIFTGSRS